MQQPYAGLENAQASPNVVLSPDADDAMGATVAKLLKTSSATEIDQADIFTHTVSGSSRIGASRAAPERARIQERVRAGLARARSEGKRLGRPRIASELEARIRKALATPGRPGVRKIAEQFGVDPGTVQRISRPFRTRELVS